METAPAAPITERFGQLFDTLDSDGDGAITWEDYQRLVNRYTSGYSLDAADRRAQAVHASYQMLWLELLRHSSAPEARLDRDMFVRAMHSASEDRSRFNMTEGVAEAVFDLLDTDDGGSVSEAEYVRYAEILGVASETARERFRGLDTDSDGFVNREEFVLSSREYLFGDDPDSPGGFVFGVI
ncbi:EF-hand domain-containing protein [Nocardiopsis halotolerans]|uniref:EF-hand domain-containing protein n=1 Tax=Nocardiopsis halotolerans TaxID=124252 RepID=UPI00034A5592|nr:EF-hand domain-containing protein [Nocardiopsis halotolerans]